MRRALGRLLGVVLTLALVSVVALSALAELARAFRGGEAAKLPLFFNGTPSNVHDKAEALVERVVSSRASAEDARELARLGGAALPHLLPKLDALRPKERMKVALALAPVARRMGIDDPDALASGERAVAFWERFWQDHSFDFRPQVVRRLVQRYAERSSVLARDDILRLDTYALPELVLALGRIRTAEDVARAHRLTQVLEHTTGRGPVVGRDASVAQARASARVWRTFLVEEGADFTTLDGPRRLVAMFAQTVYGRWLGRVFGVVRVGHERQPALGIAPELAVASLTRYVSALLAAVALGAVWARFELNARRVLARASRLLSVLAVSLPAVFVGSLLGVPDNPSLRSVLAVVITALLGAAVLSRMQVAWIGTTPPEKGLPFRTALAGVLRALPSALPWLATSLFTLELAFALRGAARATTESLFRADVTPGMALALGCTLIAAAIASLAEVGMFAPVQRGREPALVEVGGAEWRRLTWAALGILALLFIFGAGWGRSSASGAPAWPEVAQGARALLSYGSLAFAVATVSGFALGALSAQGPGLFDAALVRAVEIAGALPGFLWAAALAYALGPGVLLALGLGLMRGIDVAWVLRAELVRRARGTGEAQLRSLGHYPLLAFYRQQLRHAAAPALAVLVLSPAWWLAIGTASRLLGIQALPGSRGWDSLLAGAEGASPVPSFAAVALLGLTSWILLAFVTATPRRVVGAFRASVPPPAP